MSEKLLCPTCPGCEGEGYGPVKGWLSPNPEQLFCHNNACNVIAWNGLKTLEENVARSNWIPDPTDQ